MLATNNTISQLMCPLWTGTLGLVMSMEGSLGGPLEKEENMQTLCSPEARKFWVEYI